MPSVPMVDMAGDSRSERTLSDAVFGVKPNRHIFRTSIEAIIH